MLAERRQRVREVEAALEEANAAALVLEPVAKRKLKKEVEKVRASSQTFYSRV